MSIESREATEALADIEQIADPVRQSRFYNFASLILVLWGALVFAAYLLSYMLPRHAAMIWIATDLLGVIGSVAISLFIHQKSGVRTLTAGRSQRWPASLRSACSGRSAWLISARGN